MRPSPHFFLPEGGAALFVFCGPRERRQGRGVWYQGEAAAPKACPCRATAGLLSFPAAPPAKKNEHHGGEADRPPRALGVGGVRGGVECAPGGEVFCASFRSWQFDVLSPVKSGAARRPEEGAAAARGGEADRAPCAEGVGGMGGVEMRERQGRRASARAAADTTRTRTRVEVRGRCLRVPPDGPPVLRLLR